MSKNRLPAIGFVSTTSSYSGSAAALARKTPTARVAQNPVPSQGEIDQEIAHLKAIRDKARAAFASKFPNGATLIEGAEFLE